MVDPKTLAIIGEPEDYPTFQAWMYAMIAAEWRGADEPVQTFIGEASDDPPTVKSCVCQTSFTFKPGATRARCPGCGCRYELIPPHGTSKNAGAG